MYLRNALLVFMTAVSCVISGTMHADIGDQDGSNYDEELNERDFEALRDFLKSKIKVDVSEKCSTLTISGDVRTEWRYMSEECCGQSLRGHNATGVLGRRLSHNDFDIEFNLNFNYVFDRAWAVAQIRYDNPAGVDDNGHDCSANAPVIGCDEGCDGQSCVAKAKKCKGDPEGFHGSGRGNDLLLKRAYMGYNLLTDGTARLDIELGRRGNLYNVLTSNVQFLSRLDGIVLKYQHAWQGFAEWYVKAIGFVVDERVNQFAWAMELGLSKILGSNFDFKYSIIDWLKRGTNRCFVRDPRGFRFVNSQFYTAYNLKCNQIPYPAKIYGAFLCNHAAKKMCVQNHRELQNLAWYAGLLVGDVKKEGDWSVEVQYQYVQAQSIPDDDVSGISRGNVLDESFTTCSRRGNTNFKGWRFESLYAITDNLIIDTIYEFSSAANSHIGGSHEFEKFEVETIYAF
jgi:hypothetical protein